MNKDEFITRYTEGLSLITDGIEILQKIDGDLLNDKKLLNSIKPNEGVLLNEVGKMIQSLKKSIKELGIIYNPKLIRISSYNKKEND